MDQPSTSKGFTSSNYFPNRRRVWQACTNCRARKTRCDAAKPRCGLCASQDVECIYKDSQQPRIEHNTKILLERIQMLEDRIFSSDILPGRQQVQPAILPETQDRPATSGGEPAEQTRPRDHPPDDEQLGTREVPEGDNQITIPLSHTANANHVLAWPVVRQLLRDSGVLPSRSSAAGDLPSTAATDAFFDPPQDEFSGPPPPESWRLFRDQGVQGPAETVDHLRDCIHSYFEEVNIFFPLLSSGDILAIFDQVVRSETATDDGGYRRTTSSAEYCLLLLVLCLGSFVRRGESRIHLSRHSSEGLAYNISDQSPDSLDFRLWHKAKLLLGHLSSAITLGAAQCAMLAR